MPGLALLGLLLIPNGLTACNGGLTPLTVPDAGLASMATADLFAAALDQIQSYYIRPVSLRDVAEHGLQGLQSLDPGLRVVRKNGRLMLEGEDWRFPAPPIPAASPLTDDNPAGWGRFVAVSMAQAAALSKTLAQTSETKLHNAVFQGMFTQLDNHSHYSGPVRARKNRETRDGFGGIGVELTFAGVWPEVRSVLVGSPADHKGLQPGDRLSRIDGMALLGLRLDQVTAALHGPVGTPVTLTVLRNEFRLHLKMVRQHVVPQTVIATEHERLLNLRISSFNQETASAVAAAIRGVRARRLVAQHTPLPPAGIILDLRSNPGGLLDQAVEVAGLFIHSGELGSAHGRHPSSHQQFRAESSVLAAHVPLVVLINGGSASAAEVLARALHDRGRALVIGANSFGKGTVQTVLRLPNQGELTLTWAELYTPSGQPVNGRGIMPTLCTSGLEDDVDAVLARLRHGNHLGGWDKDAGRDDRASGTRWRPGDTLTAQSHSPLGAPSGSLFTPDVPCPWRQGEDRIDLLLARALLGTPALFTRVMDTAIAALPPTSAP